MYDTCIETQIYNFQHFETGFDRETGINNKICQIIEILRATNDLEYLNLLTNAVKYIRGIRGLRDLTYSTLFTLCPHYPNLVISLLKSFVFYGAGTSENSLEFDGFSGTSIGSWKDVRNYAKFCRKYNSKISTEPILSLYNEQLKKDYELFMKHQSDNDNICPREYLSFAAKYVPRESKDREAFEILVANWFDTSCLNVTGWDPMSYQKNVSTLKRANYTLEIPLCDWDWANINGGRLSGLIIPNVYGPFGHPYYNSVIATFCHQLANGETPKIDVDGDLKLIYVGELVEVILAEIRNAKSQATVIVQFTAKSKVSKILQLLEKDLLNYRCDDLFLDPEYVAGFFDSDGSVYISNKSMLCVSFTQCVLNILLLLQKQYGGELFERNGKNIKQRKQYTLRIIGLDCKKIIEDLNKYSVLKINKIENALTYLDYINKKNCESKLELIDFIRNNDKIDDTKYFSRINWKYIAGMFDGDGYIGFNYKYLEINKIIIQFSICQKYTPNFLEYLKNFMSSETSNFFSLSKNDIRTSKFDNIIKIYNFIKQYIIVKKYQYEKVIELLNEYHKDEVDFVKIKEIGYLIKNNKHQNIEYDIDLNKENIITSMKKEILLDIENNITEEAKKKNLNFKTKAKGIKDSFSLGKAMLKIIKVYMDYQIIYK